MYHTTNIALDSQIHVSHAESQGHSRAAR